MKTPLNVFFFESAFDGTVGGSHSCMYNLIRHMDPEQFKFTVGFYEDSIYVEKFARLGIDVCLFPRNPVRNGFFLIRKAVNWYRLAWRFQKKLQRLFRDRQIDLVVNNNSIWTSLVFLKACEQSNLPVIAYERGYEGFRDLHIRATARLGASIAVSDYLASKMADHGFRSPRIRTIYDGIDPADLQTERSPSDIKRRLKIPESAKVVGVVGNIRPWKGQRYFVEAFNRMAGRYPDLYGLVVGGHGSEAEYDRYFREVRDRVDPSLVDRRLVFLGYHKNIKEIFSILDVLVHTSIKPEPFGVVLLEAMAAGTPVVATRMGGPVEILDGGACGILVPPKDPDAIVRACSTVLDDRAFGRRLIERARDRLDSRFHIRTTVRETSDLFLQVAQAGNAVHSRRHSLNN